MTADAQKLELVQWIITLDNQQLLQPIAELKQQTLPPVQKLKRGLINYSQAIANHIPLISDDSQFSQYPVELVLA